MRFHTGFDKTINRYTVHDCMVADQIIGVHGDIVAAQSHAEAEEALWKRFGSARHAATLYERRKHIPWAA